MNGNTETTRQLQYFESSNDSRYYLYREIK